MKSIKGTNPLRYSRIPVYGRDLDDYFRLRAAVSDVAGIFARRRGKNPQGHGRRASTPFPCRPPRPACWTSLSAAASTSFWLWMSTAGRRGSSRWRMRSRRLLGVEIDDEFDSVEAKRRQALLRKSEKTVRKKTSKAAVTKKVSRRLRELSDFS